MINKEIITPIALARLLGITPAGVRAGIRRGAIPAVRVLGRWRVDPATVEKLTRGIALPQKLEGQ